MQEIPQQWRERKLYFTHKYRPFSKYLESDDLPWVVSSTLTLIPGQMVSAKKTIPGILLKDTIRRRSLFRSAGKLHDIYLLICKTGFCKQKRMAKSSRIDNEKWKHNFKDVRARALSMKAIPKTGLMDGVQITVS